MEIATMLTRLYVTRDGATLLAALPSSCRRYLLNTSMTRVVSPTYRGHEQPDVKSLINFRRFVYRDCDLLGAGLLTKSIQEERNEKGQQNGAVDLQTPGNFP